MKIFTRVMSAGSSSSPLKDDGVVGMRGSNVDYLSNSIDGSLVGKRKS